jgi:hypothetical protein
LLTVATREREIAFGVGDGDTTMALSTRSTLREGGTGGSLVGNGVGDSVGRAVGAIVGAPVSGTAVVVVGVDAGTVVVVDVVVVDAVVVVMVAGAVVVFVTTVTPGRTVVRLGGRVGSGSGASACRFESWTSPRRAPSLARSASHAARAAGSLKDSHKRSSNPWAIRTNEHRSKNTYI